MFPRGQKRGLPRERDTEAAGARVGCRGTAAVPDGRKPSGALKDANPPVRGQTVPGSPGAAAVVEVVPLGIVSLLPPGDICGAEPARCLPGGGRVAPGPEARTATSERG